MESFISRPPARAERDSLIELLSRIADGNREAFTQFYHCTSARVFSLARRVIIDFDLSRDATQEIFLQVWERAHQYNPSASSPMAWLMAITHCRAVDTVRSKHSGITPQRQRPEICRVSAYDEVAETVPARLETQSDVDCREDASALQREAIDLAYYRCLTYHEVAYRLAVPLPTVKAQLRDGLRRLAKVSERP